MKTKLLQIVVLVLSTAALQAQSLYQDSEKILKLYTDKNPDIYLKSEVFSLMARYAYATKDSVDFSKLMKVLEKNPYLFPVASDIDREIKKRIADELKNIGALKIQLDTLLNINERIAKRKREADAEVETWKTKRKEIPDNKMLPDSTMISLEKILEDRTRTATETNIEFIQSQKNVAAKWQEIRTAQTVRGQLEKLKKLHPQAASVSGITKLSVASPSAGVIQSTESKVLSFQGVSQSALIDGVATFVAKRIKQEVKNEFFMNFGRLVNSKHHNEITFLFPNTVQLWERIELYEYATFINVLRSAFKADLETLPINLATYLGKGKELNPELRLLIRLVVTGYQRMMDGMDPVQAIQSFVLTKEEVIQAPQFHIAIAALREISQALYYADGTRRPLLTSEEFSKIAANSNLRRIFCGLVYQNILRTTNATANDSTLELTLLLKINLTDENTLMNAIAQLYSHVANINEVYTRLKQKHTEGELMTRDIIPYVATVNDLARYSIDNFGVKFKGDSCITKLINDLLTLQQAANKQDYSSALLTTFTIISDHFKNNEKVADGLHEFIRYGTFMVEVANAKTANDVSNAIDAAALPVGSYSIKRRNYFNVSLNFYPGIIFGAERVKHQQYAANVGFTAPGGIAFSWGTARKYKETIASRTRTNGRKRFSHERYFNEQSFSIFVTLIDLAAPVLFRLQNDESEGLPENVEFAQFISPGVSGIYGLKNTSVSILAGAQLTPELRKFESDLKPALRFNIGLVLDIPVFNIATKTRRNI